MGCLIFFRRRLLKPLILMILAVGAASFYLQFTKVDWIAQQIRVVPLPTDPPPPVTTEEPDDEREQACVHPKLQIDHPDIMQFFHIPEKKIQCHPEKNWVYTENEIFRISKEAVKLHGVITCDINEVIRDRADAGFKLLPVVRMKDGDKLNSDFFKAQCKAGDGKTYYNIHKTVVPKANVHARSKKLLSKNALGMNVLIFGFDSVSHMTWMRVFPKTHAYMTKVLGAAILDGYNIVGDGTPQQLLPIMTGKTEIELPEARRGKPGAKQVDGHPWFFYDFEKNGYVTQWGEAAATIGAFNYRMLGFKNQPVDHYVRPFYLLASKEEHKKHKPYCLGNVTRHKLLMEWNKALYKAYPDRLKFSKMWHCEYTHQGHSQGNVADDDLKEFVVWLHTNGHLNNTLLMLISDHGARFQNARRTVQGKYEERMPYISLRFPDWFKQKYPKAMKNLKKNIKRLSTPFDLHETVMDVLNFNASILKGDIRNRGISLLREIPKERTCANADVDLHWCACVAWKNTSTDDEVVKGAAQQFITFMNNITAEFREHCEPLKLDKIVAAEMYTPNDDVLKFKQSKDHDGRVADLSGSNQVWDFNYQIKVLTQPNGGLYETTVNYHKATKIFRINERQISRINKYGDQPKCVAAKFPHLRQFCYCKIQE